MTTEERFWSHVEKTPTCWIWRGRVSDRGVPVFKVYGREVSAARYVYEQAHGPVAPSLSLIHTCRQTLCIRVAHLVPGTNQEKARFHRVNGIPFWDHHNHAYGEQNSQAHLTATEVQDMRALYGQGYSQRELAALFHCSQMNVSIIVRGKTWRHLLTADELAALQEGGA